MGSFNMIFDNPLMLGLFISPVVLSACAVAYVLSQRRQLRFRQLDDRFYEISRQKNALVKDVAFYEKKKSELMRRALQRRQLVTAARALGACLDPADIQTKLLESASAMFPGRSAAVSVGQNPDAVDAVVIQKGHPVMVPSGTAKGPPLMAVPIKAQGSLAGILRVGADNGPVFTQDEFRLLDILGSLASLALENSLLFHRVQESALRDNLTGLWTHKAFQDQLESALLDASRYNQPLSLILADVDHFKSVNDTHGHQAGDQILQGFAAVFGRHVRDVDVVSRYGGEEFAILLLQTPHAEAARVAEAIRADFERQRFAVGAQALSVTASFGVATFPTDATSGQQLVRTADERLYRAKRAGRNQVMGKAA